MRLKKDQVEKVSRLVMNALKEKGKTTFKVSEDKIYLKILEVITGDLQAETKLDNDVRKIMDQYKAQIASGQVDAQKVFQMIKKQLIKERNLVI